MAIGVQPTGTDVSNEVGTLARQTNITMTQIQSFKTWLDAQTDATLQAAPYNISIADISTLRSTMTDLDKLRQIYQGLTTQASAYDFRTFAKSCYGFGF